MALFFALMIAAFAVTSVLRLKSEERTGHAEAALATAVSRRRWIASWLAFTALLFGLRPGTSTWAWIVVAYAFFFGMFGALLNLPDLFADLSPFGHITVMPLSAIEALPLIALAGIAVLLTVAGSINFRRRDLDLP